MKALLAAATAALLVAASGAAAVHPALKLVTMSPLVVKGTAFHSRERVKVTATEAGATYVAVARASTTGAFTASLGDVPASRCNGLSVRAIGARGSAATLKLPPLPACMPERSP